MPETINSAIEFLEKVKNEDYVLIKFMKKDGTIRFMKCTLNFEKIPKIHHPKSINLSKILKEVVGKKILHVFDLEKNEWKTVPYNKIEWVEDPEKIRFSVRK
jgi:Holliday junction resolvase